MSLTALAFLVMYFGGLCLAFYRPIFGLCTYVWTFYNHPAAAWWGEPFRTYRWSLTAAAVTLVAWVLVGRFTSENASNSPTAAGQRLVSPRVFADWGARLLLVLVAWTWLQSFWAVDITRHVEGCILLTKYFVLYFLMGKLLNTERTLEAFAWTHVLGAFTWGWYGFRTAASGRFEPMLGPGGDDANFLGFQMVTAIAFAGYMFIGMRGWKRWVAFATLPFLLNVVILTASRSALVALLAAGIVAVWLTPPAKRRIVYVSAALGVVLFMQLAGSELFWRRSATITETDVDEMDYSAASRLEIGAANWRMFQDHPLGAGVYSDQTLSPDYMHPQLLGAGGVRSAHNTFLAVLVNMGVPGGFIFIMLFVWAVSLLRRSKSVRTGLLSERLGIYRAATGAGLSAYYVSGQFISLLMAEAWVWLFAVLAVVAKLSQNTARADAKDRPVATTRFSKAAM